MTKENIPLLIRTVCDADFRTKCRVISWIFDIALGEVETLYKEGEVDGIKTGCC